MTLAIRDSTTPDSMLARWDTRWKLAAIGVWIVGVVSLQSLMGGILALGVALIFAALGRLSVNGVVGRLLLLTSTVLPLLIVVPLVQRDAGTVWHVGPVRISEAGFVNALVMMLRILAVGLFALVLTRTAPLSRTLTAAHSLRVPGVLVQITQLAYRYTFLLSSEVRRMRIALRARGFRIRTDRQTYRTLGYSVGSLLVRSSDHADRVSEAMRCRGFDGTFRALADFRTTSWDVLSFLGSVSGTIALVALDRVYF